MSWAKLDDRFWSHPKVQQAWRTHPRAVGLHCMAITWCAQHETDGVVADGLLDMVLAGFTAKDRKGCVDALVNAGLWEEHQGGWLIHDYLEFNESRADAEARRHRDSERKARGRRKDSAGSPRGIHMDSNGSPSDPSRAGAFDPTRPVPTAPLPPRGKRVRDLERYDEQIRSFVAAHFPQAQIGVVEHCASQLRSRDREPTVEALAPYVEHFTASPEEVPA